MKEKRWVYKTKDGVWLDRPVERKPRLKKEKRKREPVPAIWITTRGMGWTDSKEGRRKVRA